MPHLKFEINQKISNEQKDVFAQDIRKAFSSIMETGTDHIAISIIEHKQYNLSIGRANSFENICLMNLEIREGRSIEKRRELAMSFMEIIENSLEVLTKNQYITFTEHKGEDFHLIEKYLPNWQEAEGSLYLN